MSPIERNWIIVEDSLDDAESVSSISSTGDSSQAYNSGSVTASTTPVLQASFDQSSVLSSSTTDLPALQRKIRALALQNSRLKRMVRRDSDEPVTLNEVMECFMEWMLSSLDGLEDRENSLEMVERMLPFHCVDVKGGIAAEFEKLASIPLRAGPLVGSLFRPDMEMMGSARRYRQRSIWIKAL